MSSQHEIIIQGLTSAGKTFRPSDWAERLASVLSTFGPDQRMVYSPYVRPLSYNGVKSVSIDKRIQEVDPRAYSFLLTFARDNDLQVLDLSAVASPAGSD